MKDLVRDIAKRCPKGELPVNYIVIDSETTGVDTDTDRVLQWGYCVVKNRIPVDNAAYYLKRGRDVVIHEKAAAVHGITHEMLEKQGEDPKEVISVLVDALKHFREQGYMFAGHNLLAFDAKLLERESAELGVPFKFGDNEVIDTGVIVKASQIGMLFRDADTLRSFYTTVAARRAGGIFWSLDRHCVPAYNLDRFVSRETLSNAHDAGVDCLLTHHLFEVIRDTVYGGPRALAGSF